MMSAHDVALTALNEVSSHRPSQSRAGEFASSKSTDDTTATSIEASTSKDAPIADTRESNTSISFQSSSSNNSQTTVPDATTPPTSEEFSSQSQRSPPQLSQLSQLAASQLPLSQLTDAVLPTLTVATNAGQKRTFDGYVKPPGSSSSSSMSPPVGPLTGHSRNISTASAASSAVSSRELVSELRTRLSYAIVKVNKGWESLPIDEVESLTSQAGSPTSSTSTLHGRRNVLTSPRTALASLQGNSRDLPQNSNLAAISVSQSETASYADGQPSRTYESFWREQSQRSGQVSANFASPTSTNPSLAPPADITSAVRQPPHPRRSETPKFTKPPTISGQSRSDLSQSNRLSVGAHTSAPHTPNKTSHTVDMLQTTNQKSLQERDAIETLLFMSSPGNSSTMGHTFPHSQASQQLSPLRAEFETSLRGAHGRNVESVGMRSNAIGEARPFGRPNDIPSSIPGRPGDDIYDLMLDGMPDTDSSDDEIEIPITPRRLAASRT